MLLLKAKSSTNTIHGNGIMYGGGPKVYLHPEEIIIQVFYVETDFGNHMTLTWRELSEMFEVIGVADYKTWRCERDYLRGQPALNEEQPDDQASNASGEPR